MFTFRALARGSNFDFLSLDLTPHIPIHQQHIAFRSCSCRSCSSLISTSNSPPATATILIDFICERLSDHGLHNAESQELYKTRQECSRPQIAS